MMKDDIIAQQSLYSVYVHTSPGFSFAPGNVFAGYEVPDRVQVMWGQHSMVSFSAPSWRGAACVLPASCALCPPRSDKAKLQLPSTTIKGL